MPVYVDIKGGRVFLALNIDAQGGAGEYLYQVHMRTGLGSTPVESTAMVRPEPRSMAFRRAQAPKSSPSWRTTASALNRVGRTKRQAVRESFPPSIVWSGDIAAEDAGGAVLVDITSFLVRDRRTGA